VSLVHVYHVRDVGGLSEQFRQAMPPRMDGEQMAVGFAGEASLRGGVSLCGGTRTVTEVCW
jgi:hypothetical protein